MGPAEMGQLVVEELDRQPAQGRQLTCLASPLLLEPAC